MLAVEAGAISGFLAGRVLGQYEFPVLDPDAPARLLFVAPNLGHAATTLEAEPDPLLRWVALHEITHALQFGGVPWLRPHLAGMVRELVAGARPRSRPAPSAACPGSTTCAGSSTRVREGGLAAAVLGPERRAQMDGVQAFMAVLEGYAEHVMDAVGADVIDDLPRLRAAMERRRADRTGLLRLFEKLIGMDMKLRQYEQGKRFCDGVVELAGIDGLNRVWEGPEQLPTLAELDDPAELARARRARRRLTAAPARPAVGAGSARRSKRQRRRSATLSTRTNARSGCHKVRHGLPRVHEECPGSCNKDEECGLQTCVRREHRSNLVLSSIE